MAQGGINAVLDELGDSIELHIEDTLQSAHGLADFQSVAQACQSAPKALKWLQQIGVPFNSTLNAQHPTLSQRRLGGATHPRACYAQDYTGLKILHTLYDRCIASGIEFITEHYLINLITIQSLSSSNNQTQTVTGGTFWDIQKGEVVAIEAKSTIIATGGFAELYHAYTTNSYGSSGDGIAAVLRAGGSVSDMEFIQFHPTALLDSSILISESARGEGGHLIDHEGKRFTDELAPRDEVARAIFSQIRQGHHVRLDIRHLGKEKIQALMPQELHLCRLHAGIDPIKEPIPIMPASHYTMGGIEVNEHFQVLDLEGCYSIGECANIHLHGANRLGGNSLMEIIVSGRNVIDKIINNKERIADKKGVVSEQVAHDKTIIEKIFAKPNEVNFYHKRKVLGKLMYKDVGIMRERNTLHEAQIYLDEIYNKLDVMGVSDKSRTNNQNLVEFLEFRNAILLAKCVLKSAISRQESRGAHYREDFPIERKDMERHILCKLEDEGIVCR
jgi:succinate dehydrogenase / fumarate reductase flavoprotein subunit